MEHLDSPTVDENSSNESTDPYDRYSDLVYQRLTAEERTAISQVQRAPATIGETIGKLIRLQRPRSPQTGVDIDGEYGITCAPQDRVGKDLSERVVTSARRTDPTLPYDLRNVQRIRLKRAFHVFQQAAERASAAQSDTQE